MCVRACALLAQAGERKAKLPGDDEWLPPTLAKMRALLLRLIEALEVR